MGGMIADERTHRLQSSHYPLNSLLLRLICIKREFHGEIRLTHLDHHGGHPSHGSEHQAMHDAVATGDIFANTSYKSHQKCHKYNAIHHILRCMPCHTPHYAVSRGQRNGKTLACSEGM